MIVFEENTNCIVWNVQNYFTVKYGYSAEICTDSTSH